MTDRPDPPIDNILIIDWIGDLAVWANGAGDAELFAACKVFLRRLLNPPKD